MGPVKSASALSGQIGCSKKARSNAARFSQWSMGLLQGLFFCCPFGYSISLPALCFDSFHSSILEDWTTRMHTNEPSRPSSVSSRRDMAACILTCMLSWLEREAYLYPGIQLHYAPLDVYIGIHFEKVTSQPFISVPTQQQLASELAQDAPCLPLDQMMSLLNRAAQFPLYYPCTESVIVWSRSDVVDLDEPVLCKQALLQKLRAELALSFVSLDAQINEMACLVDETLLEHANGSSKPVLFVAVTHAHTHTLSYASCVIADFTGILMHGPSGSGKSALVQSLVHFLERHGCGIATHMLDFSVHFDFETQQSKVCSVFEKARHQAPSLVVMEHVDGLTHDLRLQHYLLAQLEALYYDSERSKGVLVIGLTNRSQLVEQTFVKYNRFSVEIETALPDDKGKERLLRQALSLESGRVHLLSDALFAKMIGKCVGFSGSDVLELGRDMKARLVSVPEPSIESQLERLSLERPSDPAEQAFLEAYKRIKPLSSATHEVSPF